MAGRGKRRRTPVVQQPSAEQQASALPDWDSEQEDMVNNLPEEDYMGGEQQDKVDGKEKFFALSRCRYSSGGEIVTAEQGDEIIDPDPKDFQDLLEHGCVETFTPSQIEALLSLRGKDPAAKARLAAMVGVRL